ncbi:hypothetical protein RBH26_11910 [Natronolimnohabitans sp. A-GB9]|uniref:hypothetical protein n=1 Tax=Natronolimnohabitans sp. A-GB9 TaxID=3069757 RepID=UPI0027AFD8C6|nr:hypothetical protein [Natronolimnohabitans sp. A-GB9]MDQ2051186.1 hypothetical protein [Natronolimnohabitans sp. A-GB9]
MDDTNETSSVDRPISRRTALLGLLGGVAGSAIGYDRLLRTDESAFAETDLELTTEGEEIPTEGGRVNKMLVSKESTVEIDYKNIPSTLKDEFELTLEANPYVDRDLPPHLDGTHHSGWSDPHEKPPDDLEAVFDSLDGEGNEENPYKITNDHELQAIKATEDSLKAHYELTQNIDASGTDQWEWEADSSTGFDPIWSPDRGLPGFDEQVPFSGKINGNGYKVFGLTINRYDDEAIGFVGVNNGTIENIGLVGCEIESEEDVVGGIAGANSGEIRNSYIWDSTVTGNDDAVVIGGLAALSNGSIKRSYAGCQVELTTSEEAVIVGGLLGANVETSGETTREGIVSESYADCKLNIDIEDEDTTCVTGVLTGINLATISNSYARGELETEGETDPESLLGAIIGIIIGGIGDEASAVIAGGLVGSNFVAEQDDDIGGLLGLVLGLLGIVLELLTDLLGLLLFGIDDGDLASETGMIESSYAAVKRIDVADVDEDESAFGGFVGANEGDEKEGEITGSYWDDNLLDLPGAGGIGSPDGLEGLSTNDMTGSGSLDEMGGLSGEKWEEITEPEDDYPQLQENPEPPEKTGSSTEFEPILEEVPVSLDDFPDEGEVKLSEIIDDEENILLGKHDAITDGDEDDGTAYRQFEPYPGVGRKTKIDFKLVLEHDDEDIGAVVETTESATVHVRIPGITDE